MTTVYRFRLGYDRLPRCIVLERTQWTWGMVRRHLERTNYFGRGRSPVYHDVYTCRQSVSDPPMGDDDVWFSGHVYLVQRLPVFVGGKRGREPSSRAEERCIKLPSASGVRAFEQLARAARPSNDL